VFANGLQALVAAGARQVPLNIGELFNHQCALQTTLQTHRKRVAGWADDATEGEMVVE
jgi:hypothetical protein